MSEVEKETTPSAPPEPTAPPTNDDIQMANKLKEEGNQLVKASKFHEAIAKYNEAIKLNRDPIYFCNRAAAYCRLEPLEMAIQDCRTALELDPSYAKAYGRMAVALSCQHRYDEAVDAYKHALELDPSNESYKTNMALAEEKQREAQQAGGGVGGGGGGGGSSGGGAAGAEDFGGFPGIGAMGGLGGMLNNPQMAGMAQQMMSDPSVQNMMSQMMGAFGGQGGPGLDGLMRVGEQIAESLHQSNPQLVEQLRQQFNATRGPSDGEGGESDGQNPDNQPPPPPPPSNQ